MYARAVGARCLSVRIVIAGNSTAVRIAVRRHGVSRAGRQRGDTNKVAVAGTVMPSANVVIGHGVVRWPMHKK